jgi:hypothetical protein
MLSVLTKRKWYKRVVRPPVQKNTAKAETAHAEAGEKPKKKNTARRALRGRKHTQHMRQTKRVNAQASVCLIGEENVRLLPLRSFGLANQCAGAP